MSLLRLKAVSKEYDGTPVLSQVSLTVRKGEWVGIVGESGSGKSTLLKIIGRHLDAEDGGDIYLMGEKLPPVRDQLLKGHEAIKLVHQEYELFPNQTARENITYALRFYDPDYQQQRVDELVTLTRLQEAEHRKAKVLSGGEKQRTALARAIAEPPELLLLDEPFAHLDPRNKQTLSEAIYSLRQSDRLTCIFVTHEASEAMAWADRLIILKEGKIVQEGTPEQIYNEPANVYVAELTGLVNLIREPENDSVFCLRPNHLRPVREESRAVWRAEVHSVRFKGSYYEYYCQTPEGQALVYFSNQKKQEVGEEVFLSYSPKRRRRLGRL
jgi:ABC-type Fe3+/spermidine/putrescine transport system ATPase subunit